MAIVARGSDNIWEEFQSAKPEHIQRSGEDFLFEIISGILYNKGVHRSEIRTKVLGSSIFDLKYGYTVEILTDEQVDGSAVNWQLWDGGSPSNSIRWDYQTNKFFYRLYNDSNDSKDDKDLFTAKKGVKNRIVIDLKGREDNSGYTKIYINGELIVNKTGRNLYGDIDPDSYIKSGLYDDDPLKTQRKAIEISNIIIGDQNTTLEEMEPGGTIDEPKPIDPKPEEPETPTGEMKLTFVNAQTETDIREAVDGAKISLSDEGTHKISVRADCPGAKRVLFELYLDGYLQYEYIDSSDPFSLWGDDGNGNYYYGHGMEEGNYGLEVTAYDIQGNEISSKIILFSVYEGAIPDEEESDEEDENEPGNDEENEIPNIKDELERFDAEIQIQSDSIQRQKQIIRDIRSKL